MPTELLDASGTATKGQLVAALGVMAAAVTLLFKLLFKSKQENEARLAKQNELSEERWQKCEEKHSEAQARMLEMASNVGKLQGQISVLSNDVLNRVAKREESDAGSG